MNTFTIKEASEILGKSKSTVRYQYEHKLPASVKYIEDGILYLTEEGLNILQAYFGTAQANESNETASTAQVNELTARTERKQDNRRILEDRIKSLEIENATLTERIEQMKVNESSLTAQMTARIDELTEQVSFLRNQLQSASVNLYKALPEPRKGLIRKMLDKITGKDSEG